MRSRVLAALAIWWFPCGMANLPLCAQEHDLSFIVKGNLTTSSQLFPNPNAEDPAVRATSYPIENIFGYGFEVRYHIPGSSIAIGASADLIRTTQSRSLSVAFQSAVPLEDGYHVIPVELTGYFLIPASGPSFGIFMGGGIGVYFGERTYRMAGTEAGIVSSRAGLGIHVLGGVSYRLGDWFTLLAEMKFRDLQFKSTNAFSVPRIIYRGAVLTPPQQPFESSVHTDGIIFQLGAAFNF